MSRIRKLFQIQGYPVFIVCLLLVGIGISITQPYLSLFCTEDFGMTTSAFGFFMAISSLCGVIVNSLIARHSDNGLDRRKLIIVAMISSALAYVSYLVFHKFIVLLIAVSFLNGIGAATMPQIYAYAQESANESKSDDKALALSSLRSLVSLGFLIGPLSGAIIWSISGYSGLFIGTALIYLIMALVVILFLKERKTVPQKGGKTSGLMSTLKDRRIGLPTIAFVLLFAINAFNGINTPLFIINVLHGTHAQVGLSVSLCAGLEIPIMLVLGAMGRKISAHTLMLAGCVVTAVYYTILSISSNPWELIGAQLLQATFVAVVMGNGLNYFARLLPHSPGMSTTIYSNSSTIGRLLGTMSCGVLAQLVGFRMVFWACLVIALTALVVLWLAGRGHEDSTAASF